MATVDRMTILHDLEGEDCPSDEQCSGTLKRGTYKGDEAVICEDCETPVVRLW